MTVKEKPIIIALGMEGDTFKPSPFSLQEFLEKANAQHELGASIYCMTSRLGAHNHFEAYGRAVPDTEVQVDLGTAMDLDGKTIDPIQYWSRYDGKNIRLFVCSSVLKESHDSRAGYRKDGADFARNILAANTPRLVTQLSLRKNPDVASEMPDEEQLEKDFGKGLFHVKRDRRGWLSSLSSVAAMNRLVGELWNYSQGDRITFSRYMDILRSPARNVVSMYVPSGSLYRK